MPRATRAAIALFAVLLAGLLPAAAQSTIDATAANGTNTFFAGHATSGPPAIILGRTLQNGEMDTSFASGGLLQLAAQPGATSAQVTALTVGHAGDVLLSSIQGGQIVYVHFNSDGSPFGGLSGLGTVVDSDPGLVVNAVYVDPPFNSSSFYALGSYTGSVTSNVKTAAIVHYYQGVRDPLFGTNGIRTYNLGTRNGGEFLSYVEMPNWTITAVGDTVDEYPWGIVAKLTSSMDLDTTFSRGGLYTFVAGAPIGTIVKAIGSDGGGGFLVAPTNISSPTLWDLDSTGSVWWWQSPGMPYNLPNHDRSNFLPSTTFYAPNGDSVVAGTVVDTVTGRTFFGQGNIGPFFGTYAGPITADNDDVLVGAYPVDGQQFLSLGTRQTAAGDQALRIRYWYDGTFDTDFSLGPNNTAPNPFGFMTDFIAYGPAVAALSTSARITGVNAGTTSISVVGGQYAVSDTQGCGGATTTSTPGTVNNGQWVCVAITTATTPLTTSSATLTVGGVQAQYNVTTGTTPVTVFTGKPSNPSGSSVQFTYGNSSYNVTGPLTYQCQLDGTGFSSCTGTSSYSNLLPGSHTFTVQATNPWGTEAAPPSYTWTVAVPPSTTITSMPPALTNQTSAVFGFASSDPSATFQCKLDSGSFAACSNPATYGSLAAGSHTFSVRSSNSGGVDPSPPSYTWTIDNTPPDTTITSGPSGTVSSTSATLAFTSTKPGSTFQCSLDSAAYASCSTGIAYSSLAVGSRTFRVYAVDAVGNADLTPASRTWTIDNTPPDTTITSGPSGTVSSTSATFAFTSTKPGSTFQCSLDSSAYMSCSTGIAYSSLAAGSHAFTVYAVDSVGNVDPTPASRTWTIDNTPPDTTITSGPSGTVSSTSATFAFTSTKANSTFQCSLDNSAYASCATGIAYSSVAAGAHTFRVYAVDAVGNVDTTPASRTWTIDNTPPDTTITSGPSGTISLTTATFAFTSTKPSSTFQCSLDGSAYSSCASGIPYSNLGAGSHTFTVYAVDSVGNVDPTPASRTWSIDTNPPHTSILSAPTGIVASANAQFTFSSSKADSTYLCSLDGAAFSACSTGQAYSALPDGAHAFTVEATDGAGRVDPSPPTASWTIDTIKAHSTITQSPGSLTNQTTATFYFVTNDPRATVACILDGVVFNANCSSPATISNLSNGTHTFTPTASNVGGTDPSPSSYSWTVDTAAPRVTFTSAPIGTVASSTATFAFTSSKSGSNFVCNLDYSNTPTPCNSGVSYSNLVDGEHEIYVTATDPVGNTGGSNVVWWVDTTPPKTTINSGPYLDTNQTGATFYFAADDSTATYQCSLDGAAFAACASPLSYSGLAAGNHVFSARGIDPLGNVEANPPSYAWTIDLTPPTTTVTSGPTPDTSAKTATFTFTSNEAGSTFVCWTTIPGDVQGFYSCASPVTYTGLADGGYVFYVRAIDPAGNWDPNWNAYQWTVDTTAPDTSITSGPPVLTNATSATFTFGSNESTGTFQCALDGAAYAACTSPKGYSGLIDGAHTFKVRAIDGAGNIDPTPSSLTWTVDTSPPHATITSGPSGSVASTSATFGFVSSDGGSTFTCSRDGAAFAACSASVSYSGLAQGAHTFSVKAQDAAGNVGPAASQSWTVDTVAPTASISSGPSGSVASTSATFTYASSETGSTFDCKMDSGSYATCAGSGVTYSGLTQGSHTFSVRAHDAAGNVSSPATRTWTVDTVAPDTTITGGPTGSTTATTATFTFTSTESPATFQCSLDNAAFTSCASGITYSGYSKATHTFQVRSIDAAGNVDPTPASRTWTRK